MVEQAASKYQLTLSDTELAIHSVSPVDGTLTYVSGAARPAPKEGVAHTEQEDEQFSQVVMMALSRALGGMSPEITISIEGKGSELARLGQMLQTMVEQMAA
jgi:hypothetical protein